MAKKTLFVTAVLAAAAIAAPLPSSAGEKTHTLFAGGDVNLGRWVPQAIQANGAKSAFEEISDLMSGADITLVNLECVISSKGRFGHKGDRRPFLYRGRPELLDVLTEAGVDVAVAANNHSMDYGPDALVEEIELLGAAGIAAVGVGKNLEEARRPVYVKTGDLVVAFVGLETEYPRFGATDTKPGVFNGTLVGPALEAVKAPIAEAREHADLVVFTPHWGDNWVERPAAELKEMAHAVIDLGVDAIVGHSSHHILGLEVYKGKPIVYDIGAFLFDTVGQGRLRYSAGYVLEFDARGVSKITMHPLLLKPNRTTFATGAAWDKIKEILTSLSAELDPKVPLTVEGTTLVLQLPARGRAHPRQADPERVHVTGSTRPLPPEYRARRTEGVVLDAPPEWAEEFEDVPLDNGVVVIGARSSDAVRVNTGFTVEVALRVPGPLAGPRWVGVVQGRARDGDSSFIWAHPIADGGWIPALWEKGQIVVDLTLVRSEIKEEGVYDLFWRLEEQTSRAAVRPVDAAKGDEDGFLRIGEIEVKNKGIPAGPAGVAWDGLLPKSEEFDPEKFEEALEADVVLSPLAIAGIAAGAALVLAIGIFLVVRVRRRRGRSR